MPAKDRWVYLTTAPDQTTAEMWEGLLRNEGLPVMVRSGDTASFMGVFTGPCRLMVLEERLEEAREVITEQLGPEALL